MHSINAFKNDDHVNAVKYLYAYFELNKKTNTDKVNKELLTAIEYAEEQIYIALKTKEELDKYGKVTEATIESSGRMDTLYEVCFSPTIAKKMKKPQSPKLEKKYSKEILKYKHQNTNIKPKLHTQ